MIAFIPAYGRLRAPAWSMMATELRLITFKEAEIVQAVTGYFRRRNLALPRGTVTKARAVEDGAINVVLTIRQDDGESVDYVIADEPLAAALLLYCFDRKIPLPVESQKRLYRVGDELGLVISIRDR